MNEAQILDPLFRLAPWVVFFPVIGLLVNIIFGKRLSEKVIGTIASLAAGLAFCTALALTVGLTHVPEGAVIPLANWITIGDFQVGWNFRVDTLSAVMMLVVSGVGTLIHIYSIGYMHSDVRHNGDPARFRRFFVYLNLFIAAMMILVSADNFLMLFVGWEGVGLCSYLLIGFWFDKGADGIGNAKAGKKAMLANRVGDFGLLVAMFLIFYNFGTLNFADVFSQAPQVAAANPGAVLAITLFLLLGVTGKSAQIPLYIWLPDAMAGPTPVSALIHAATMVTAGVYLIARTHGLFLMTPEILHLVGIVGAVTLVLAGFAALVQTDIKRVLAYSTMSQIGYMFLALGVQAWDAAIFHLMTHAFFKALLFLSSGSVILACHHEQNIFKMGGLRKSIPLVYVCFLVGGAALSALPLITAGFFSKDEILAGAMANGHINLMVAGLVGAFMTSLYTFRMIFIVFHGKEQIHAHAGKGITHHLPLIVLLILSTFVGALIVPPLQGVLPQTTELEHGRVMTLEIASGIIAIAGILIAAWLWLGKRTLVTSVANSAPGRLLGTWWYNAWGFDWLYDKVFVKPFLGIAWLLKSDPLNAMMNIPAILSRFAGKGLLLSENGYLRWYVASMSIGAVVVLALLMVLR